METLDLTITLSVEETPQVVYAAINNVSGWWTKIEGDSKTTGDIFTVHFGQVFMTHKVVELVPGKKVLWLVTDTNVDDWKHTRISFEISSEGNFTVLHFTHIGMHLGLADYQECVRGWNKFIHEGLVKLITESGKVPA
jgi:hypothetical protein